MESKNDDPKSKKKPPQQDPLPDPKVKPAPGKTSEKEDTAADTDPFDFGGLPKRDLKKNLGCG